MSGARALNSSAGGPPPKGGGYRYIPRKITDEHRCKVGNKHFVGIAGTTAVDRQ
jgi:hypothetical protein